MSKPQSIADGIGKINFTYILSHFKQTINEVAKISTRKKID